MVIKKKRRVAQHCKVANGPWRHILRVFVFVILLLPITSPAIERFTPEHFTGGWSSSDWGPAVQASGPEMTPIGEDQGRVCGDKLGNIYLGGHKHYQYIDIVTPEGMRYHIAGKEQSGFRDGPGRNALFRMAIKGGQYGTAYSIGCGPDGSVFVCDNGNYRVRRIYKQGDEWFVETWAGGGNKTAGSMTVGQTIGSKDIILPEGFQTAVNRNGNVFIACPWGGNFKMNATGDSITKIAYFTVAAGAPLVDNYPGSIQRGCSDTIGNVYFGTRSPDRIYKIDSNGISSHIGINPDLRVAAYANGASVPDGPPLEIYFDTQTGIAVAPDGSCVYVNGGDQYHIVRVPTDLVTHTSKMAQNGNFYECAWTKSYGGPFLTNGVGPIPPLQILKVQIMWGTDLSGNIYGGFCWTGNGLVIDGKTPQALMFRLRRVIE